MYANNQLRDGTEYLELDAFPGSGPRIALYGYYDRNREFVEMDRERRDQDPTHPTTGTMHNYPTGYKL